MFKLDSQPFFSAIAALAGVQGLVNHWREIGLQSENLTVQNINALKQSITMVQTGLTAFGAPLTAKSVERLGWLLDQPGITTFQLEAPLRDITTRLLDEMSLSHVYVLQNSTAMLYRATECLFGEELLLAFPSAEEDIRQAGNCVALHQGTAAVFHLMRVMERGLKALGKRLGIPYAPSWESYIKQIDARIAAKHKTKGVAWRRDEKFYRDLAGDLLTIKHAWRNPTMHIDRAYAPEEALSVFIPVRSFMQRLSTKITEAS